MDYLVRKKGSLTNLVETVLSSFEGIYAKNDHLLSAMQ